MKIHLYTYLVEFALWRQEHLDCSSFVEHPDFAFVGEVVASLFSFVLAFEGY